MQGSLHQTQNNSNILDGFLNFIAAGGGVKFLVRAIQGNTKLSTVYNYYKEVIPIQYFPKFCHMQVIKIKISGFFYLFWVGSYYCMHNIHFSKNFTRYNIDSLQ